MKLLKVKIRGFRGFHEDYVLSLRGGRSVCFVAQNGRGKSSLVDALEFWCTGDVGWVHRDGVGLPALIHLLAEEAHVEIETDRPLNASRTLSGSRASSLILGGPAETGFQPDLVPILRYKTMALFVDQSANDKRRELLKLLGLDGLLEFRSGVRTLARRAIAEERDARSASAAATGALEQTLGDKSLGEALQDLSNGIELPSAPTDRRTLLAWRPRAPSPAHGSVTALARAEELMDAHATLSSSHPEKWADVVADREVSRQAGLGALLAAGRSVLDTWEAEDCPLCLQDVDRRALVSTLVARAVAVADAEDRFSAAESELLEHLAAVTRLGKALGTLLDDPSWDTAEAKADTELSYRRTLDAHRSALREYMRQLREAQRQRAALPERPAPLEGTTLEAVRTAALSAPATTGPALLEISQLQGLVTAADDADATASNASRVAQVTAAARDIAEKHVDEAIDEALARLNTHITRYYARLLDVSNYSDVRLVRSTARAGGIEFSLTWGIRTEISPPQRIMSESQLNALGLAVFLARLKEDPPLWRVVVLDDVVASFDAINKTRLIRLLQDEFAGWQIVLLTHDTDLAITVSQETDWLTKKVIRWDPMRGPDHGEADPRKRLAQRLDAGHAADELGSLARQAVERALELPVKQLRLRIPHDPQNRYTAADYLEALVRGLREGSYPHADHEVLSRLQTDGRATNRACHFKLGDPGLTEGDLRVLLEDLEDLDALFKCTDCDTKAWTIREEGSSRCRCNCGKLAYA